ncbi:MULTISPECIES: hypothetical protein [Bacillus]|uniref:hypothetical protein n=1 Tax=Bacillus TaxID=1386 RepID=UPI000991CDF9|nr:hypothetical protein [Bacillus pseudomycoides]MED4714230.1 hypothetical protein [Bacillus pseudomycoides]OOR49148.1 hypothetical protein BLX05_25720 [Bacillus pseudomycoides]
MNKMRKWLSKISVILVLVSTFVIAIPSSSQADNRWYCLSRCGDGIIQPGDTRDVTPKVFLTKDQLVGFRTWQDGYRYFYYRIYNINTGAVVWSGYTNGNGEGARIAPQSGTYVMELKCTTGSSIWTDCRGSGQFFGY